MLPRDGEGIQRSNARRFPTLGHLPMTAVTTRQVMDLVKKIEKRGAGEIAMRVLQRIKAIYRYGVTHQRIQI